MRYDVYAYVGHDVNGMPRWTRKDVTKAFADAGVGGCTVTDAHGVWNGVCEDTSVVYIANVSRAWARKCVRKIVPAVRDALEQECIMVDVRRSRVQFV